MLRSNRAPEVIPWMRIVMQVEKGLQARDGGLTIGCLKLLVNGRREQERAHRVQKLATPKLVRMTGCHADHVEKRCDKPTAHQSVMCGRFIKVERTGNRHDGLE